MKKELIERIEIAFDGVPAPSADERTLLQAEAWDNYDVVDQTRDHKGRWQDLPDDHLARCQNALPHLGRQGIQYYLPAVMRYCLGQGGDWLFASLLFTLQPSTGELKAYQRERFSLLTAPQRDAILSFLEFVDDPEALPGPWRRVVDGPDDADWFRRFY